MQTLNEYMQSNTFAEKFNKIINDIEDFEVPDIVKTKLIEILTDNEFEIASYQYDSLISDYEDYEYEKHKEEKYFKDDK